MAKHDSCEICCLTTALITACIVCDIVCFSHSMYMLVRTSQHVTNTQDSGSFLSVTFASSLVKVKRSFDKFIVSLFIVFLI